MRLKDDAYDIRTSKFSILINGILTIFYINLVLVTVRALATKAFLKFFSHTTHPNYSFPSCHPFQSLTSSLPRSTSPTFLSREEHDSQEYPLNID